MGICYKYVINLSCLACTVYGKYHILFIFVFTVYQIVFLPYILNVVWHCGVISILLRRIGRRHLLKIAFFRILAD